ncbi:hypothetical protein [Lyngbya sp. CCY1209]|jgi:hypothetical protein|uniref:hypothetical protein n=1 Tax=Lyngbya sp. CCY1209 TaxID=2886103 RepID=UPI002D2136C3|nr:hypothetical protein [Lyngbya sp. CCY1209]MEB3882213.1 hypothetical protein [Lyngbya sp. CCY1209]
MSNKTTDEDLELLAELGVDIDPEPPRQYSPREERIIAGFEEIDRFVAENGRLPQHGGDYNPETASLCSRPFRLK